MAASQSATGDALASATADPPRQQFPPSLRLPGVGPSDGDAVEPLPLQSPLPPLLSPRSARGGERKRNGDGDGAPPAGSPPNSARAAGDEKGSLMPTDDGVETVVFASSSSPTGLHTDTLATDTAALGPEKPGVVKRCGWLLGLLRAGLARFASLKTCPRELWLVYGLKFLESYAYFAMSLILTLYLSEFGYSDSEAGWVYGLFGTLTSAYGMVIGFVIDNLGVRRSLILGAALLTAGRLVIAITTSKVLVLVMLYSVLPLGSALGIPVMMTGIRRYTNDTNRTFGFSLFYSVMNVAAMLAGYMVDGLRKAMDGGGKAASCNVADTGVGGAVTSFSAYRTILLTGAGASFLMLAIAFGAIREIDLNARGETTAFTPRREAPWRMARTLLTESSFWRFVLFVTVLIGVKSVFRHLDATLPKFMLRAMGCGADYGTIYSINPIMVIVLVPILSAYTMQFSCYNQILVGSFITGASVFLVVAKASYATLVLFVIVLALGESLWSPRLYEYCATIAPVGREGTYMALATVPTFVATVFTGGLSGWLLSTFCPCVHSVCEQCCTRELAPGETPCAGYRQMWLIVAAMTIASPILLLLLRPVIEDRAARRVDQLRHTELDASPGPGVSALKPATELAGLRIDESLPVTAQTPKDAPANSSACPTPTAASTPASDLSVASRASDDLPRALQPLMPGATVHSATSSVSRSRSAPPPQESDVDVARNELPGIPDVR